MFKLLERGFGQRVLFYLLITGTVVFTVHYGQQLQLSGGAIIAWLATEAIFLREAAFDLPFFIMRGKWRYHKFLISHEVVVPGGRIGHHLSEYFRIMRAHKITRYTIRWPFRIALLTTLMLIVIGVWHVGLMLGWGDAMWMRVIGIIDGLVPDGRYWLAGYLPLFISVPFRFECATEWRIPLYVFVANTKAKSAKLLVITAIFVGKHRSIALKRLVSSDGGNSSWRDWWLIRGKVTVHEIDGGEGIDLAPVYNPDRVERLVQETVAIIPEAGDEH